MHDDGTGIWLWPFNPEGAKKRKLLTIPGTGVESKARADKP